MKRNGMMAAAKREKCERKTRKENARRAPKSGMKETKGAGRAPRIMQQGRSLLLQRACFMRKHAACAQRRLNQERLTAAAAGFTPIRDEEARRMRCL
jgi:hypothetical protein